jgi:hypothetical protein
MSRAVRTWTGRVLVALVVAAVLNLALSELGIEHDVALVSLLVGTTVAAGGLALEALDTTVRLPWTATRPDARPLAGEDTRTAMYRHVIEAHLTSRDADDTIVWRITDLAAHRLRQVHGFRYADDPARATELLGPDLADWLAQDRRHRYRAGPGQRFSVAQLGEAVRRIEEL